jgi:hypothetical protein
VEDDEDLGGEHPDTGGRTFAGRGGIGTLSWSRSRGGKRLASPGWVDPESERGGLQRGEREAISVELPERRKKM